MAILTEHHDKFVQDWVRIFDASESLDDQSGMHDVEAPFPIFWYGVKDIPLLEHNICWEEFFRWTLIEIDIRRNNFARRAVTIFYLKGPEAGFRKDEPLRFLTSLLIIA